MRQRVIHFIVDLSVWIIDDNHERDRILERIYIQRTNLHAYVLIDLPVEQPGDSSHEHTGVGMAPMHLGSGKYFGAGTP